MLGVFLASIVVIGASGFRDGLPTEEVAIGVATGSMSLTAAVVICSCLVRQVDDRLDRGSRQGPADGAQGGPGERSGDQPVGGRQRGQQ